MNKYCYMFILSAFAMLVSCGQSQQQSTNAQDNKVSKETVEKNNTSYDLAFYGLKGNVKKMNDVEFDQSGKVKLVSGNNPFAQEEPTRSYNEQTAEFTDIEVWKRDKEGRIYSQSGLEYYTVYVWDGYKMIRDTAYFEGQIMVSTHEYDAKGNEIKVVSVIGADDGKYNLESCGTIEYTYKDFDSNGNWLKRSYKSVDSVSGYTDVQEQTRTIEYYK